MATPCRFFADRVVQLISGLATERAELPSTLELPDRPSSAIHLGIEASALITVSGRQSGHVGGPDVRPG
jgi:hypothetical protein